MIELRNVTIRAGDFVLSDVSFCIESGQYAVIMGRTGIGKTTILEAVCGLRSVEAGTVLIDNVDVTSWPPGDRDVGYLPQDLALFPTMRVREQISFAMRLRGQTQKECHDRANELADLLDIMHLLDRKVHNLSGGEAQRVALGRALSFRPRGLLLDEPLSALDAETRDSAQRLLKNINRVTGVTVLHVTHNPEEAATLSDRQLYLTIEEDDKRVLLKESVQE